MSLITTSWLLASSARLLAESDTSLRFINSGYPTRWLSSRNLGTVSFTFAVNEAAGAPNGDAINDLVSLALHSTLQ